MSKRTEISQMTAVCRPKVCDSGDALGELIAMFGSETHLPTDQMV